ncbi:MAG TPA: hypothetical protein VF341_13920 [Anaeromyxobacteraceae bacterium]
MLCKVIVCAVLLVSVLRVSADELALAAERGAAELGPDCRVGAVFRSLLVPGYGQLARGERVKGALVLGAEVALLGSALAFHLAGDAADARYGPPDGAVGPQRLRALADARHRIRDALLLGASALWVASVADAFLGGRRGAPALELSTRSDERRLAPLAAIRPGLALLGVQGRF